MDPLYPFLGMVFGVLAVLVAITIYFRQTTVSLIKMEQDQENMRALVQRHVELAQQITGELKAGALARWVPAVDFVTALMQQWDFFAKLVTNRVQKASIAQHIATHLIDDGDTVFIDSGSTTDLIPKFVVNKNVSIYTNNVFAVVSVSGIHGINIFQLPGWLDYNYAATYSPWANSILGDLTVNKVVIAARSIALDDGLRVATNDDKNREFKRLLLRHERADKFIIAVDWTKFRSVAGDEMGVLQQAEWDEMIKRKSHNIIIVTNHPPQDAAPAAIVSFEQEMDKFVRKGFTVEYAQ